MSVAHASDTRSPSMPSRQTSAWSFGPEVLAAASRAANSGGCNTVRFWPSQATFGRVTAVAGLAGMSPSMDGVLVERRHGSERAGHRRSRVPATLQVTHIQLELTASDTQHRPVIGLA